MPRRKRAFFAGAARGAASIGQHIMLNRMMQQLASTQAPSIWEDTQPASAPFDFERLLQELKRHAGLLN